MTGTKLLLLHGKINRLFSQAFLDLFSAVADHQHGRLASKASGLLHRIMHHGLTVELMQHLGQCRLHAGSLTGRQNNGGESFCVHNITFLRNISSFKVSRKDRPQSRPFYLS